MTFDPSKVPGGDVAKFGAECRAKALDGVTASDWRPIYDWTKSWIGWGGGAWLPDTWILYAVSALLQGKPRIGVHALDLGINTWIDGDRDRSVLTFCRGAIVLQVLVDPKCAEPDLEAAAATVPEWLVAGATERLTECRERTPKSRKRVPSVKPRPDHAPPEWRAETVAPAVVRRADGDEPEVRKDVCRFFLSN
jgi:hypothetical protein